VIGPADYRLRPPSTKSRKTSRPQHAVSARRDSALRIAIHTRDGHHETDKELGNASIGYLAHRLGLDRINPGSQWPEPDLGDPRHCSRCFDSAGSVSCSVSRSAVLGSDWTGSLHSAHEWRTHVPRDGTHAVFRHGHAAKGKVSLHRA